MDTREEQASHVFLRSNNYIHRANVNVLVGYLNSILLKTDRKSARVLENIIHLFNITLI